MNPIPVFTVRRRRRPTAHRKPRGGMSAIELVMTTALMFPSIVFFAFLGVRALRVLFTLIGTMIGSPLL
ncbi:hypothetical protein [Neorhodopirellula pilleata]|uniref:Uncharacterized protein n=1 Tax=Neorhodopirellula pilleata TaxID=2714738 RepID=A0A5C6AUM4_9BACT|nr:hypothetical protein [Neorhodopirellula pilleata]TWU03695.1 hypothetical protein Pla100_06250 [Neorhodopirellula pilleata]